MDTTVMDTKGVTTVRGTTVHITHTPNTEDTAEAQWNGRATASPTFSPFLGHSQRYSSGALKCPPPAYQSARVSGSLLS